MYKENDLITVSNEKKYLTMNASKNFLSIVFYNEKYLVSV